MKNIEKNAIESEESKKVTEISRRDENRQLVDEKFDEIMENGEVTPKDSERYYDYLEGIEEISKRYGRKQ